MNESKPKNKIKKDNERIEERKKKKKTHTMKESKR